MTRSHPRRVNTDSWTATSSGVPGERRPPISEYSPSLFSRTISMSMSAGPRPASEQTDRTQVHVLAEAPADRDQEPPQRHVVRHAGKAYRAEKDPLEQPELVEAV